MPTVQTNGEIERSSLLALLNEWRHGAIDERSVHEWAEETIEQVGELPQYDEDDPRSIAVEILLQLDALNHQLITRDDIPAIEAFLQTRTGDEARGWANWKRYWQQLDLENRRKVLKENPYYST